MVASSNVPPPPAAEVDQPLSVVLRRYAGILRKRMWIVVAILAAGITATVLYTMQRPKIYEASATIIVNPQTPRVNKDDEVIELGAGSFAANREYYNTQLAVLKSFPLAQATVEQGESPKFYDRLVPRESEPDLSDTKRMEAAAELLAEDMLSTVQARDSRVIAIRVRSPDPELAVELANTHVASYMAFVRGKRTVGTGQASQVISVQLDDAQKQLRAAEDKIIAFKTKHDLITQSFDDKQNTVVAELQRYSAALADAKVRRIDLGAQRKRALALATEDVLESPIFALVSNSDVVDELKAEYIRASQKFVEVDATYGPRSEGHKAAKDKVDQIYAQLKKEAKRAMREIDERYQAAAAAESGYEQLVTDRRRDAETLDTLYAEFAPLVRDQKFAEDQYAKLSARLGTSRQEGQNDMINVEPHEKAREAYKVLPRMVLNIVLAAFLSLLLGVGLAFLLDHMDRTIKSAEGIQALVGSPLLGIIPVVVDVPTGDPALAMRQRDLYVFQHPTSQAAECCRSIRTNILFSSTEREVKTITVSSSRPQEGKSTTTIYLGTTMAQSGQRVLLIDTDLRKPRLHKSLGVAKERGLTTLLLGDENYDDVVKSTDVPNLYVLPCGPIPPNPAELLLTSRFKAVLEELGKRFDRILLDSPPILAVTDAVLLSRITDGIILVASAGKTQTEDISLAVRQLRDVGAPILGVILNVIDISDRRYGGYYYAYGGYGDKPNAEAS